MPAADTKHEQSATRCSEMLLTELPYLLGTPIISYPRRNLQRLCHGEFASIFTDVSHVYVLPHIFVCDLIYLSQPELPASCMLMVEEVATLQPAGWMEKGWHGNRVLGGSLEPPRVLLFFIDHVMLLITSDLAMVPLEPSLPKHIV